MFFFFTKKKRLFDYFLLKNNDSCTNKPLLIGLTLEHDSSFGVLMIRDELEFS